MFTGPPKTPTGTSEKPKTGFASGNIINTPTGKYGDRSNVGSGSQSQSSSRAMSIYLDTPTDIEKYDRFLITVYINY
jgi:hypothetical protein